MLTATLAGIPVGVAGGLLGRAWLRPEPSIRFLGRNDAMIALLETGVTRTLFFFGEPDSALLHNLPELLTVGRTRLDLLVASHAWLTVDRMRAALDLHRTPTLSLQSHASLPPIRGNVTPVTARQAVQLDDGCDVTLEVTDLQSALPADPGIIIRILFRDTVMVLTNRVDHIDSRPPLTLLAAPSEIEAPALKLIKPGLFVGTQAPEDYDGASLMAHSTDPLRLRIERGRLTT